LIAKELKAEGGEARVVGRPGAEGPVKSAVGILDGKIVDGHGDTPEFENRAGDNWRFAGRIGKPVFTVDIFPLNNNRPLFAGKR